MKPLYNVAATRAIEQAMFGVMDSYTLMQRAGAAVAEAARQMWEAGGKQGEILALAGSGNNGGDAAIAAAVLHQQGIPVRLLLAADAAALPPDAARAQQEWQAAGGDTLAPARLRKDADGIPVLPAAAGLLIDGLFGIGLSRAPAGIWQELIAAANRHPAPTLAIDIASGIAADSGSAPGIAVQAARTISFFGGKPGHYTGAGAQASGIVEIAALDAPPHAAAGALMDSAPAMHRLHRRADSHKGDYGTLALYGGAEGMLGALVLAARAAAVLGAGKTIAHPMQTSPAVDWQHPEIMWKEAKPAPAQADCIAAGMGMGVGERAKEQLAQLAPQDKPLLLDADALTMLSRDAAHWQAVLRSRAAPTILTPHPAEAARLLGSSTAEVNAQRIAAAAQCAEQWRATVVLKGAGTIVQTPGEPYMICAAGNPGLARGGSGDVLSGMIAALLAQTADAAFAAQAGVWLHAAAADALAAQNGEMGVDVNQLAREAVRQLRKPQQ